MSQPLPVAGTADVRRYAHALFRRYPRALGTAVGLHALAALAGLAGPRLLGDLVEAVQQHRGASAIDRLAVGIAAFVVVQAVLIRFAVLASARLGERVLASLREDFVDRVLRIPLSTVERAGTGDLLTRTTRDVDALSKCVRFAVPETMIAAITVLLVVGALALVTPLFVVPLLVAVPVIVVGTRWYLRRAPAGYLAENAAYSQVTDGLAETVEGARTVEALRRQRQRIDRSDADLRRSWLAERYTLSLRTVFWPTVEVGYVLPVVATLLAGGWMYARGWVTLGQATAAIVYVQLLVDPLDRLLSWLDELQVGAASLARLLGVAEPRAKSRPRSAPVSPAVPRLSPVGFGAGGVGEPVASGAGGVGEPVGFGAGGVGEPVGSGARGADGPVGSGAGRRGSGLEITDLRFAYVPGREVLRGISLAVEPGERLAIVGPSGAGKSTLGRLIAGIHRPTGGSITVGGVPLGELSPEQLRTEVALVTQEHHVFVGTLRDNVALARPESTMDDVRSALAAVHALDWAEALPDGLDTTVGSDGLSLSAAQSQQVALARLVLADPHTLVLDEATSLLDPRAARDLERSLAAVLHGRTVIAIAHRLFSAHDADRVAVVEDGLVTELGPHDELVAAGGSYAALWRSWHGDPAPASR